MLNWLIKALFFFLFLFKAFKKFFVFDLVIVFRCLMRLFLFMFILLFLIVKVFFWLLKFK